VKKKDIENAPDLDLLKDLSEDDIKKILEVDSLDVVQKDAEVDDVKKQIIEEPKPAETPGPKRRGPKVKWTPEKIEEFKKAKKAEKDRRNQERQHIISNIKITNNVPLSSLEKKRIAEEALKTRDNIQNEIIQKRTILKGLQESVLKVDNCNHKYKFKYFLDQKMITACEFCSAMREFEPQEWDYYNRYVVATGDYVHA
jgi:hypothetical protein